MYTPKYQITHHLLKKLETISALKTKIESAIVGVSWIPKLVRDAMLRIAHSSTAIEGNTLTLQEVGDIAEGKNLSYKSKREKQEILNYLDLMKFIANKSDHKFFSENDVFHMHKLIGKNEALEREPVGQYRTFQVFVGAHHPHAPAKIKPAMEALIGWLNKDGLETSSIISSAVLHYRLETIHPFGDGNGRLGRAWAIWELYRRGFDTHHIFTIDEIYLENRKKYYAALAACQAQGENADITGWLEFVAEVIEWSLEKTLTRIDSVRIDKKIILNTNQEKLLSQLRNRPMHIQEIMQALNVTKSGAHVILKPLIRFGIVSREGGYQSGKYLINKD